MLRKMVSVMMAMFMLLAPVCLAEGTAHTHAPSEEWDRDLTQHWHNCECGEKLEAGEHEMDEFMCTVCGSEIWDYGDGSGMMMNYNEYGDLIRYTDFDETGSIIDEYLYLIEYDAEGNRVRAETYWGEMLVEEIEYALNEDGVSLPVVQNGYGEDGSRSVNEYDEYGNIVHMASYDPDGELVNDETIEYKYDEDGMVLETTTNGRFVGEGSYVYVDNQYGDSLITAFYDAEGELEFGMRTEYEYDESGNRLQTKTYDYSNDRLVQESVYEVVEDEYGGWSYEKVYTCYEEDGTKAVYEYDSRGNELSETLYDADGGIVVAYRSEYEFDEEGNMLLSRKYEGERLCAASQYEVIVEDDGSWSYEKIATELYEDGSMYIREYDRDGNEISAGLFDENGEPFPEDEADDE